MSFSQSASQFRVFAAHSYLDGGENFNWYACWLLLLLLKPYV